MNTYQKVRRAIENLYADKTLSIEEIKVALMDFLDMLEIRLEAIEDDIRKSER